MTTTPLARILKKLVQTGCQLQSLQLKIQVVGLIHLQVSVDKQIIKMLNHHSVKQATLLELLTEPLAASVKAIAIAFLAITSNLNLVLSSGNLLNKLR